MESAGGGENHVLKTDRCWPCLSGPLGFSMLCAHSSQMKTIITGNTTGWWWVTNMKVVVKEPSGLLHLCESYQTMRSVLPYIKPRLSSSWLQLSLSPIPSTFLPPRPLFHPTWWNPGLQASGSTYSSFSLSSLLLAQLLETRTLADSLPLCSCICPPSFHLYHHTETTQQAHTGSHEPTGCLSSQLRIQWHHVGSLKSSVAGVFYTTDIGKYYKSGFPALQGDG